jgi:cytochrome P450
MFWGVTYVYSDLSLLSELRDEINDLACDFLSSSEGSKGVIHVSKLETACPLLASACEEVIRMSNRQVSIRSAVDDAVISSEEGSYAIKKDTVVFIPTPSHHTDPRVWGPDAESFNPRRFMRSGEAEKNSAQINEQKKLQKKAFFPFGGGKHMCPGRFFAHTELMTFVAVLVMGFDIVMADGLNEGSGGPLKVPERYYRYFAEGTPKPKEKLDVCIKRRNGFDDVVWVLDAEDDGTAT